MISITLERITETDANTESRLSIIVKRYDSGHCCEILQTYNVVSSPKVTVMQWFENLSLQDPNLNFYRMCRVGKTCQQCMVRVNGNLVHLCQSILVRVKL